MMQAIRIMAVLVILALFFTGCATTEQFIQSTPGISATNQALATIRFKRKSVFFGGGWNVYVIDSGIGDNTNGVLARLFPQPSPPVAVLWPPDREDSIGRVALSGTYEILYEDPELSRGVWHIPVKAGIPFSWYTGLLHFPYEFAEFTLKEKDSNESVTFRRVTVVGKTANDGVLSWQRPAGRFQVVLVYQNGWYYESPMIDARPGETTFVEFDLSEKSFNIIPGSKGE